MQIFIINLYGKENRIKLPPEVDADDVVVAAADVVAQNERQACNIQYDMKNSLQLDRGVCANE